MRTRTAPEPLAARAGLVDRALHRARDGAHRDDQRVGVLGAVRHHRIGGAAAEARARRRPAPRRRPRRPAPWPGGAARGAPRSVRGASTPPITRGRSAEAVREVERRQEAIDRAPARGCRSASRVREDEAVLADHAPAGAPGGPRPAGRRRAPCRAPPGCRRSRTGSSPVSRSMQRVAVIGPDVPGRPERAVDGHHHDREAQERRGDARSRPCRRGRSTTEAVKVRAPRAARADADRHGAVLALDPHDLALLDLLVAEVLDALGRTA